VSAAFILYGPLAEVCIGYFLQPVQYKDPILQKVCGQYTQVIKRNKVRVM
jgi:Cft2 family RNA processing exonuclease